MNNNRYAILTSFNDNGVLMFGFFHSGYDFCVEKDQNSPKKFFPDKYSALRFLAEKDIYINDGLYSTPETIFYKGDFTYFLLSEDELSAKLQAENIKF
jgi:hypothetical protein